MKSIHKLFGNISTAGSVNECREVVSNTLGNFKEKQKWCKLLIDEVHIKPAIRYRGSHLIGSAIDDPSKAARTALTIMICPLMGAPVFVARILPIYSINHKLLYDAISKIISIIHEFSGRVFLVMTDNLLANVMCFKTFHDEYGSLNQYSIVHPCPNETFSVLFLLYDLVHLFKNIYNNW